MLSYLESRNSFARLKKVECCPRKLPYGSERITTKYMCPKQEKDRAAQGVSTVFNKITERFGLLFAGDRIVVPEELERPVGDALHCRHSGSKTMVAESSILWWSGRKKDNKFKRSTCTASLSTGKKLKYQLPSTEKIN